MRRGVPLLVGPTRVHRRGVAIDSHRVRSLEQKTPLSTRGDLLADIFRRLTAPGLRVRGVFGRRTGRGRCARRCRTLRSSANETGHVTRRRADCRSRRFFCADLSNPHSTFFSFFSHEANRMRTESLRQHTALSDKNHRVMEIELDKPKSNWTFVWVTFIQIRQFGKI